MSQQFAMEQYFKAQGQIQTKYRFEQYQQSEMIQQLQNIQPNNNKHQTVTSNKYNNYDKDFNISNNQIPNKNKQQLDQNIQNCNPLKQKTFVHNENKPKYQKLKETKTKHQQLQQGQRTKLQRSINNNIIYKTNRIKQT